MFIQRPVKQKVGNVLFNDALNTFYLWLYCVGHIEMDYGDSQKRNLLMLPIHELFFSISQKGSFYIHNPTNKIAYIMFFVIPVMEHWLEQEIAQCVNHEGSIQCPITPRTDAYIMSNWLSK